MPRSPSRAAEKLGFESTKGHRNHLYLMYVLILFVLITVFVTIYGGVYNDLPERNFNDTVIHGGLTVKGSEVVEGMRTTLPDADGTLTASILNDHFINIYISDNRTWTLTKSVVEDYFKGRSVNIKTDGTTLADATIPVLVRSDQGARVLTIAPGTGVSNGGIDVQFTTGNTDFFVAGRLRITMTQRPGDTDPVITIQAKDDISS